MPRVLALLLAALLSPGLLAAHEPSPDRDPREADVSLNVLDVVVDAPWRVQRRGDGPTTVPVLFFFPEVKRDWRSVRVKSVAIHDAGGNRDEMLYEHRAGMIPQIGRSASGLSGEGIELEDAWGRPAPDIAILADGEPAHAAQVRDITDANRGFHAVLKLRVPAAFWGAITQAAGPRTIALAGRVEVENLEKPDGKTHVMRRRLEIQLDNDALPMLPGWRTYDTHVHTMAEFDPDLSFKALRKNHGGPVRMLAQAATALGMIEDPSQIRDRVMTTDHNCYFSDKFHPMVGPTVEGLTGGPIQLLHPEWMDYFRNLAGEHIPEGQREFENYDQLFGATRGEEISLAKDPGPLGRPMGALAAHMIVHGARHFCGPFHGGKFLFWREANPNTVERVLPDIAASPHFRDAFAYAAHPFTDSDLGKRFGTYWDDRQLGYAVRTHVTTKRDGRDRDFVFKGFQLWNQKDDRLVEMPIHDRDRLLRALEDPRREKGWAEGNPNWDDNLNLGLQRWHQMICDSFNAAAPSKPAVRFVRKLFAAGGSDAHADFNRYSDCAGRGFEKLPFPLDRLIKGFSVGSNAFAKVRIAVDSTPREGRSAEAEALHAYAHGQSSVTDGPVLDFAIDADGHFDVSTMSYSPKPTFRQADGRMGGEGWLDGARTALVAIGSARPMLRFRWTSSPAFGGPLKRIELYRDEPGKSVQRLTVHRNTGPAQMLAPDGVIDPAAPADREGWRTVDLAEVPRALAQSGDALLRRITVPTALSLGGFTARTDRPPFDFRCYTNPIWLVPAAAGVAVAGGTGTGRAAKGALRATFRFPISMTEKPLQVRLIPLDASGASIGAGHTLIPEGWSASPRETIASSVFTATNAKDAIDLTATANRKWCLALIDPHDAQGNKLNSVAWIVEIPIP